MNGPARVIAKLTFMDPKPTSGPRHAFIGLIDALDEATAKERAIKQFDIRPEDRDRLIAVCR